MLRQAKKLRSQTAESVRDVAIFWRAATDEPQRVLATSFDGASEEED